jgi:diguanylate cyclase (GGDEF)-like protein
MDRLNQLLIETKRNEKRLAVLFLDLDNFKQVNDSIGHIEGDNLLVQATRRLREAVRGGDTVGRLGGDEFVVLLGSINQSGDVRLVAENLLKRFHHIFRLNDRDFVITASLGIALYPEDGESADELLRNADTAMYHAKELGRNTYCYFTTEMNQDMSRRQMVEEQLHGALARGEFHVCYQPMVDIKTHSTISAEALLRWNNQLLGAVPPEEFIPIAEQTRLINQIGRYVLDEALYWAAYWKHTLNKDFKIAVNLSPRQFRDLELVPFIEDRLQQSGISGSSLELEIKEGVLMQGQAQIDDTLSAISKLGIGIAIDDFGTGYSSLNYLRRYPFNVLKIDRSFIRDITIDPSDRILVKTAIAMAHSLGLEVVAEGVETQEQLKQLDEHQCDIVQGNLMCRPVHPEELTSMMFRQSNRLA